jgi:hypothetical protein
MRGLSSTPEGVFWEEKTAQPAKPPAVHAPTGIPSAGDLFLFPRFHGIGIPFCFMNLSVFSFIFSFPLPMRGPLAALLFSLLLFRGENPGDFLNSRSVSQRTNTWILFPFFPNHRGGRPVPLVGILRYGYLLTLPCPWPGRRGGKNTPYHVVDLPFAGIKK